MTATERRIRFLVSPSVSRREEVLTTVRITLGKYMRPEWYKQAGGRDQVDNLVFTDESRFHFFEQCLLYTLASHGLRMKIESRSTNGDSLSLKELQGK